MLTFTPYHHWRWEHAMHHATNGDLDRRGIGDIWTSYSQGISKFIRLTRINYRFVRNPFVLFVFAPHFPLHGTGAFSFFKMQTTRKAIRTCHELSPFGLVSGNGFNFWVPPLPRHSSYYDGRGGNLWNLAFLCSTPI